MKVMLPAALTAGLLLAGASVMACDQMGPNVHVGNVVSIDRASSTFVILDAQSQQPIQFTAASAKALDTLHVNDSVKVNYEETEGKLRSVKLTRI